MGKANKWVTFREGSKIRLVFVWRKKHIYQVTFNNPRSEHHTTHGRVYPYAIKKLDGTGKILMASGGTTAHYPDIMKHVENDHREAVKNFQKTPNWEIF